MLLQGLILQTWRRPASKAACLAAFLLLPAAAALGADVTLAWDPNTERDLAGYRLHSGTQPGAYDSHNDVGMATVFTLRALRPGRYYFAISAYNKSGRESGYSNEIEYYMPPPPVVTGISRTAGPPGIQIVITGQGLDQGTAIDFNGVAAPILQLTAEKAVLVVPARAASGPVTVKTRGGTALAAANFLMIPAQSSVGLKISPGNAVEYRTLGMLDELRSGYAAATGGGSMAGIAFVRYSENGTLSSAASSTPALPLTAARIAVDHRIGFPSATGKMDIRTGFSIVNRGPHDALVELTLRDQSGRALPTQQITLAAGQHLAKFLDEFWDIPEQFGLGSLEISSNQPVYSTAMRLTLTPRGKLLLSTIPVADAGRSPSGHPLYFPLVNTGGGFQSSIVLLNTSDQEQTGRIILLSRSGGILHRSRPSSTPTMMSYRIMPGGVFQMSTSPVGPLENGWIKVMPGTGSPAPTGVQILGYSAGGSLVAETCTPAVVAVRRALVYIDETTPGRTELAIANPGSSPIRVDLGVQGESSGSTVDIPAYGAAVAWTNELVRLPEKFKGALLIRSSEPFLPVGIRFLDGVQEEPVCAAIQAVNPDSITSQPLVFPQIVEGNGYQTEFVFMNAEGGSSPVDLQFFNSDGVPLAIGQEQ